ncbi:aminotransferase class I/II-fold pyridoxal phosphate-dependent enzyme [Photorhabdus khanii]|uniref:aminotransferase class I/II-fold pyridoxal phosphate-dependent enzyme n=1 Tax=Photorhabdus khanii TaxID=1004150 RepID=UPI003BB57C92
MSELQNRLRDNIFYFDEIVSNVEVKEKSSPIRTVFIGLEDKAIKTSQGLREKGILVTAAMYPTVSRHQSIVRVAISAAHTRNQIERFAESLSELTGL